MAKAKSTLVVNGDRFLILESVSYINETLMNKPTMIVHVPTYNGIIQLLLTRHNIGYLSSIEPVKTDE